jgi:serine/threonine protein kinase
MNPARWARVKELFQDALERPPAERAAFLAAACGEDLALRSELESLLAAHDAAGPFIEGGARIESIPAPEDPVLGQRVGPYRVLSEIGRGGMGTVYRAIRDDDAFRKEVALKIVQGGLGSEYQRERFRQERQILATLDHPGVARLLDGGATEDGRPYLVMELVAGEPIDVYCARRGLAVRERLALFRQVCAAVQYAHQNLVVHRDLKPSNILVTADGAPKLLDFGIAKLLPAPGSGGEATVTELRALTPYYASPEQVKGEPITTASDVYSLGVLLYELLTGRRPFELEGRIADQVMRLICHDDPERPSTAARRAPALARDATATLEARAATLAAAAAEDARLRRARELRGDLDLIVMTALRKEPQRRYGSVQELAEDVRRYLAALPIRARPDTVGYRAGKFVRRHRLGVAAAALLVLSLAAGVVATFTQWRRAEAERARAERRFADVRRLANTLIFEVHDQVQLLPGATRAREAIVRRALEYLDGLAREAADDRTLQRELAAAYERIGDVQGTPGHSHLGDSAGALVSQRKALAIREALGASADDERRELAGSLLKVGDLLRATGSTREALATYRRAFGLLDGVREGDRRVARQRAAALVRVGRSLLAEGDTPAATSALERAVALYEAQREPARDEPDVHDLVFAWSALGPAWIQAGKAREAIAGYRTLLPVAEAAAAREPANAQARRDVGLLMERLGSALRDQGDLDGALEMFRRCLEMDEAVARGDPGNAEAQRDVSVSLEKLGRVSLMKGDATGALPAFRRAVAIRSALLAADPGNRQRQGDLSTGHYWIAQALLGRDDLRGAREQMQASLRLEEARAAADPDDDDARDSAADTSVGLADVLTRSGEAEQAIALLEKARAVREELAARDPTNADRQLLLGSVHKGLGDAWAARAAAAAGLDGAESARRWREARAWYSRTLAMLRDLSSRGLLAGADAEELPVLERAVARCDAALSKRRVQKPLGLRSR